MSYPTSPVFNAVNMTSQSPTLFSETISGRQQSRKIGGQKWTFTATYPPMTQAEFQPVWAFVVGQQGRHGTFTITPPVIAGTSGTGTGTVTCTAAAIGAVAITITGLAGTLKAGDFIKFANHTKVYMLTADRSGAGAIAIEPALVEAVADSEQMYYNDIAFTVRLANDIQSYKLSGNQLFAYEIDVVEAL
jgi:hypothetical protein